MPLDHNRIAAAGWAYRTNARGWIIYRNPETGLWHTRAEAVRVLDAKTDSPGLTVDSQAKTQPGDG